ncbi:carboxymuconolactone decarboxylase family protein [Paraburkholderia silviterrae]|uniref:Carboxymuconolactone decarboxylase family protein n=1 Tax=Paraburkholderia silviterrae TaxID=2528715 RepID=A0A4R5M7G8_9BURK|nr:carboxymuconolactone decarboxylase family protein [Paraburkholderia silviterrae]TDG22148.1 carboxymuconolactone decarboxylase family protein [Paraburkholderia silviterrae]
MPERISFGQLPSKLLEAVIGVEQYVSTTGLDFKLLELVRARVSQLNGCAYCLDRHIKEGVHAGEDPLRYNLLPVWHETPHLYSAKEQAALRWAEALTLISENEISETLVKATYEHFERDELANLTLAVAQINTWNRLAKPFAWEAGVFQAG